MFPSSAVAPVAPAAARYGQRVTDDGEIEAIMRRVAAVTDTDLAAAVLANAAAVLIAFDAWRIAPCWRDDNVGRQLHHTVETVRAALAALPDREDLASAVTAVLPLLNLWWPSWPAPASTTAAAVEQLRLAAMHQPVTTRQAREIVATLDSRDQERLR